MKGDGVGRRAGGGHTFDIVERDAYVLSQQIGERDQNF